MNEEVAVKIFSLAFGPRPIRLRVSLNTSICELSEFLVEYKNLDPEYFSFRFYEDA